MKNYLIDFLKLFLPSKQDWNNREIVIGILIVNLLIIICVITANAI